MLLTPSKEDLFVTKMMIKFDLVCDGANSVGSKELVILLQYLQDELNVDNEIFDPDKISEKDAENCLKDLDFDGVNLQRLTKEQFSEYVRGYYSVVAFI